MLKRSLMKIWKVSKKKKKRIKQNSGNKSSLSQIKNTVESHFSRLEQVEARISGLEDR
jgi:hypothetical protein